MGEANIKQWIDRMMKQGYIQEAFERVICKKIRVDGYVDISAYSYLSRDEKPAQKVRYEVHLPRYISLVKNKNYLSNDLSKIYQEYVITQQEIELTQHDIDTLIIAICKCHAFPERLSPLQAEAIVDITMSQVPLGERNRFFNIMFDFIRNELKGCPTPCDSQPYADGKGTYILYDNSSIEIKPISSVSDMITAVNEIYDQYKYCKVQPALFYRGQGQVNFTLVPQVFRTDNSRKYERTIYQDMMIACPDDLVLLHSHIDRLAMMQHYQVPTRLLDVSRNPLVALFMATNSHDEHSGEVFVFAPEAEYIKYHDSDTVSVLSSLALFDEEDKKELFGEVVNAMKMCNEKCTCKAGKCELRGKDPSAKSELKVFNEKMIVHRLVHEVSFEKPGFLPEIVPCHLLKTYFVNALKDNARIIRQDGAFMLCGLDVYDDVLNKFDEDVSNKVHAMAKTFNDFRYKHISKDAGTPKTNVLIIPHSCKETIRGDLEKISINQQTMMPEISDVGQELAKKYVLR